MVLPNRPVCTVGTIGTVATVPLFANAALGVFYRPGGPQFELFETDKSDVTQANDFMIPLPKLDTKGIRVLIR
jgi:hypothetical protein